MLVRLLIHKTSLYFVSKSKRRFYFLFSLNNSENIIHILPLCGFLVCNAFQIPQCKILLSWAETIKFSSKYYLFTHRKNQTLNGIMNSKSIFFRWQRLHFLLKLEAKQHFDDFWKEHFTAIQNILWLRGPDW